MACMPEDYCRINRPKYSGSNKSNIKMRMTSFKFIDGAKIFGTRQKKVKFNRKENGITFKSESEMFNI